MAVVDIKSHVERVAGGGQQAKVLVALVVKHVESVDAVGHALLVLHVSDG